MSTGQSNNKRGFTPYDSWSSSGAAFGQGFNSESSYGRPSSNQTNFDRHYDPLSSRQAGRYTPVTSMPPTAIWSEISSSSGVVLDKSNSDRLTLSIDQLKRPPAYRGTSRLEENRTQIQNSNPVNKRQDKSIAKRLRDNDYTNNYIHTGDLPSNYVRNVKNPVEGYPKLQRLFQLKESQTDKFACTPYGARVDLDDMVPTLNGWIHKDKLVFDVIMIGALTENQFIFPLLTQLPLEKLCSKPGFLFVWASAQKINELTGLLNSDGWAKKFRRSEELVFIPVSKDSPYYPEKSVRDESSMMENTQWHCWMCITGTVRRSSDGHLIHCNVDTDLKIDNMDDGRENHVVPNHMYKVAENFSSATRRLHIIPSRTGYHNPVRPRRGWVIMSPDIIVDNFDASRYRSEILNIGANLPQTQEIENLRPKSPAPRNANLNTNNNNHNHRNHHPITSH